MRRLYIEQLAGLAFIAHCFSAGCDKRTSPATTRPGQPPLELVWNFDEEHSIAEVGWLAESNPDNDYGFSVNGHVTVKLKGRSYRFPVSSLSFARRENVLHTVRLVLPNETIDDVYREARAIAQAWDLAVDRVDQWRIEAEKKIDARGLATRPDRLPGLDLEIISLPDDEKPWYIVFTITWPRPEDEKFWPKNAKTNW